MKIDWSGPLTNNEERDLRSRLKRSAFSKRLPDSDAARAYNNRRHEDPFFTLERIRGRHYKEENRKEIAFNTEYWKQRHIENAERRLMHRKLDLVEFAEEGWI